MHDRAYLSLLTCHTSPATSWAKKLALLLAAVLALSASTAGAAPQRAAHDCVKGGELWFNAADGTRLVGHRFGKGSTAVILTHQSEGDLCD